MLRMRFVMRIIIFSLFWILSVKESSGVSFYGSSYLKLPLQGTSLARRLSEIEVEFKTSRSKGLLLVAIGSEDHLLLRLRRGQVQAELRQGTTNPLLITSKPRPKFSDLQWHRVRLSVLENSVQLYVDDILHKEASLPSRFAALSTTLALYIGGKGLEDELEFLTGYDVPYRGCMQNVYVNSKRVLNIIQRNNNAIIGEVTWDCSPEFEANRDDPFSFVKETSFISFQKWLMRTHGSIQFWLRTSSQSGLLLFNHGKAGSFFATELWKGRLRILFNGGGDTFGILSSVSLDDGKWHFLKLSVSQRELEISIDLDPETFPLDEALSFSFTGYLYIGGVVHRARQQAVTVGLHSIVHPTSGGSFEGCIRDIELDNEQLTLGDTQVTHGIEVGCVYQFPCSDQPCINRNDVCHDIGISEYECVCPSCQVVTPPTNKSSSLPSLDPTAATDVVREDARPLYMVSPLSVSEGSGALLTIVNIRLNFNLDDMDLRESQLIFRMVQLARYGRVEIDIPGRQDSDRFTLLDLIGRKISYIHDGSENFSDLIAFEMSVLGRRSGVPSRLRSGITIQLPVEIVPVNDPPFLVIAEDNSLRIISMTRRQISPEFLTAEDPDTSPEDLVFTIISQPNGVGQFELDDDDDDVVTSFTQADVNKGDLFYVHTGPQQKSRIVLRVSDGIERSDIQSLRIEAMPLTLRLQNSSQLMINPQRSQLILPKHLQVVTNDPDEEFDVTFRVVSPTRFGDIQKLDRDSNNWFSITTFLQRDIDQHLLRYIASSANGLTSVVDDEVILAASSGDASIDVISIQFQIVVTSILIRHNTGLILDSVRHAIISDSNLTVNAENPLLDLPISINILRIPMKGDMFLHPNTKLTDGSNFTVDDLKDNLVSYQVHPQYQEGFNDSFLFQAVLPNAESEIQVFNITFIPDLQQLTVINEGATVSEGGSAIIDQGSLFLFSKATDEFTFTVTKFPAHGNLQLYDGSNVRNRNVSSFLSFDLKSRSLRYQHDDSESMLDEFSLDVRSTYIDRFGERKSLHYNTTFNVSIQLQNDNVPLRVVDKVYKVLKNGKTPLTDMDLSYHDNDSDFDDADIFYQRLTIRNGDIVSAEDESQRVLRFTQRDLTEGNLIFKHRGDILSTRMTFFVFDNDRSNLQSAFLQIEAYEPYLQVVNNTGIEVQKGSRKVINASVLSTESNLKIREHSIVYLVTSPPRHGQIMRYDESVLQFTQEDIQTGIISYISSNDTSSSIHDSFNFTVQGRDLATYGTFAIRIYLSSTQTLPTLVQNETLYVEEGMMALIPKSSLKVSHPNHPMSEISYIISKPPRFGFLELNPSALIDIMNQDRNGNLSTEEAPVTLSRFTQLDINRKRLVYVQTISDQSQDTIVFNVTNGYTTLTNVTLRIEIVPDSIPVEIQNMTVEEGMSKVILFERINVSHPFYRGQDFDIFIVTPPRYGIIEMVNSKGIPLASFTTRDIRNEFVYYVHNGSESLHDSFEFILNSTSLKKESDLMWMHISVTPVNDIPPFVSTNKNLMAITDARTLITTASLSAEDADSSGDEIVFLITVPTNGKVVLGRDSFRAVSKFTQADLEASQVFFIHSGARSGGFRFQVSDGLHNTLQQIFTITAQPLLLSIVNNTELMVKPGTLQPITAQLLKVITNENPVTHLSHPITYVVTAVPSYGKLVKVLSKEAVTNTFSFKEVMTFTQMDIDDGLIAYKHKNISWSQNPQQDVITFDVFLSLSQNLTDVTFDIFLGDKDQSTPPPTTVLFTTALLTASQDAQTEPALANVEVEEGESVNITLRDLISATGVEEAENTRIEFNITSLPSHGSLVIGEQELRKYSTFRAAEVAEDGILYNHDDSEERGDSFNLTVKVSSLIGGSLRVISSTSTQFVVGIIPVNDHNFKFLTPYLRMNVIQGAEVLLTPKVLNVEDLDNFPSEIVYHLFSQPSNGELVSAEDPTSHLETFSQEDVNQGRVLYKHNGGERTGAFLFRVTDGSHLQMRQFYITVTHRALYVTMLDSIALKQGASTVTIKSDLFNITSNSEVAGNVHYNITLPPLFGRISLNGSEVASFSHSDIAQNTVTYTQLDFGSSQDHFTMIAYDDYATSDQVNLTVTVRPQVFSEQISAHSGSQVCLTTVGLNATLLDAVVSGDIIVEVLSEGLHTKLVDNRTLETLTKFTFSSLSQNEIAILIDHVEIAENETLVDLITLNISAAQTQSVTVTLVINVSAALVEPTTVPPQLTTEKNIIPPLPPAAERNRTNFIDTFGFPITKKEPTTPHTTPIGAAARRKAVGGVNIILILVPLMVLIIIIVAVVLFLVFRRQNSHKSTEEKPKPVNGDTKEVEKPPIVARPVATSYLPHVSVIANPNAGTDQNHLATQPIISRSVQSPLVPEVKVTPLGRPPSPKNSYASLTSNGSVNGGSLGYNWQTCDPDLVDHLKQSNPSLQRSQYWV